MIGTVTTTIITSLVVKSKPLDSANRFLVGTKSGNARGEAAGTGRPSS